LQPLNHLLKNMLAFRDVLARYDKVVGIAEPGRRMTWIGPQGKRTT
jgi:hypothetical protein